MKKIFIAFATMAAGITCNAQLFWKVSGNGLEKPSYIMGTHHVAPASTLDSVPGFNDALANADMVYGEIDMLSIDPAQQQQIIMTMGMAPADSTLTAIYTKEQFDSIDAVLGKYTGGMVTLNQLAMMKPALVSTQLAMLINLKAFPGFNPAEQLDQTVQQRAKQLNKKTGGFETLEFQMNMLLGDAISEQAKGLLKAVRTENEAVADAQKLAADYRKGDLAGMWELMSNPATGFDEETAKTMIYDRNAAWVKTLKEIMPQGSVVVAVGAGHLPTDKGVLELLRQEGYTVEPVK